MEEACSDTASGREARPSIERLHPDVINRIAAGEVCSLLYLISLIIQRPSNALKELLENSLDAGATQIKVICKEGGMKLLQIQDNGCGIQKDDLPLLCERFATSKLRQFEDLSHMTTFGFRGEALASISYVSASVQVVTKIRKDACAYKAAYFAGALQSDPTPCAGTDGTSITVQDLFFNAPQRRKAFKSNSEEYNRILDVMSKYALHFGARGVGFSCKKADVAALDLNTPSRSSLSTLDVIKVVYGSTLARDLLHIPPIEEDALGLRAEGWMSNANWISKKAVFICFINDRLVESPSLKRALESMYALFLPKGRHPWIYVHITIDPTRIDVNVHPTKQEVHFLDEEDIFELITTKAQDILSSHSSCRVYSTNKAPMGKEVSDNTVQILRSQSSERYDPRHLVRVDHKDQSLDAMLVTPKKATVSRVDGSDAIPESACELTSILELRRELDTDADPHRTTMLQNHSFVGVVDLKKGLSLIQYGTQLYLVHHGILVEEFCYQLALRQFGAYITVQLDPPTLLSDLVGLGYDMEDDEEQKKAIGIPREDVIQRICRTILRRADMLQDYFGIEIDPTTGLVHAIPTLLPNHGRFGLALERLPTFFFRLGPQVDWDNEKGCFYTMCRELAYAHVPASCGTYHLTIPDEAQEEETWTIQHVWFAHMSNIRGRIVVPKSMPEDAMLKVANLPDLYRVFERC